MAGTAHYSTMRVDGLGELIAALSKESVLAKANGEVAVTRTAQAIEGTSKELAPEGPTGDLRRSIHVSGAGTKREVGPSVRYGGFVEYGTWKDDPQPYMGPAADRHAPDLEKELERLVGNL